MAVDNDLFKLDLHTSLRTGFTYFIILVILYSAVRVWNLAGKVHDRNVDNGNTLAATEAMQDGYSHVGNILGLLLVGLALTFVHGSFGAEWIPRVDDVVQKGGKA